MALLERDQYLHQLHDYARQAANGDGRLVFVGGEMGIGKTTLVETFLHDVDSATQMTIVSCDGLRVHGPLGPLFDIAHSLGPEVERMLEIQAPRDQLFRAVERSLTAAPGLTILVGEDVHWGDEASLDLLHFRRHIGRLRTLFIATYRDDEIPPDHPLRRVMGDLATAAPVRRMILPSLSIEAVSTLAADSDLDPVMLRTYTNGNPFFISELLDAGTQHPIRIEDAILSRASRLPPEARSVLDMAAIIGVFVDPDLLREATGAPIDEAVEACLAVGLFRPATKRIEFRHGAVRDAVARAISPLRSQSLHRQLLEALGTSPRYANDHARLAFHAEESGQAESAYVHALAAAEEAAAYKSHREALAQYARALRHASGKPRETQATLLEAGAWECYLTGRIDDAMNSQEQAVEIRRALPLAPPLGESVRRLSRYCWFAGNPTQADHFARQAIEMLAPFPESREMAMAYSNLSQLRMLAHDVDESVAWGSKAIALAEQTGDVATLAHALNNVGTALNFVGESGTQLIRQAIDIARANNLEDDVSRGLTNLGWTYWTWCDAVPAREILDEAIAYTEEHDLLAMHLYLRATSANLRVLLGDWEGARQEAELAIAYPLVGNPTRIVALVAIGRSRIRQGDTSGDELDRALDMATGIGELQRLIPVHAARAEAAWLANDRENTIMEASAVLEATCQSQDAWLSSELAIWLYRSGAKIPENCPLAEPFRLEIEGDWQAAAAIWREKGIALYEARALAASTDERDLRAALTMLDRMGAMPDAAKVADRLRALGYRRIPRGPRPGTRANYALLTQREVEVLTQMADGATNREIAERLYLSRKTVEHHVSAILAKLDVPSRETAVTRARDAGVLPAPTPS